MSRGIKPDEGPHLPKTTFYKIVVYGFLAYILIKVLLTNMA